MGKNSIFYNFISYLSLSGLLEYTLRVKLDSWPGSKVVGTIK